MYLPVDLREERQRKDDDEWGTTGAVVSAFVCLLFFLLVVLSASYPWTSDYYSYQDERPHRHVWWCKPGGSCG